MGYCDALKKGKALIMSFLSTKLKTNNEISIHMKSDDEGFITNSDNGDVFEINRTTKLIFEM